MPPPNAGTTKGPTAPTGSADPSRLLDPQGIALVERMELVARTAVEGLLSGLHPSPFFGSSGEKERAHFGHARSVEWMVTLP